MRTAFAVITGYITMVVLVFFTDIIVGAVLHGDRRAFTIVNVATALPYAVVGGYIAARIAEGKERAAAIGLGIFATVIAVALLSIDPGHQPLWYSVVLLALFAAGTVCGGYLRL